MNPPLLAKPYDQRLHRRPPQYATLVAHTCDVSEVVRTLLSVESANMLGVAGLARHQRRFAAALLGFAFLHDIGKANSNFIDFATGQQKGRLQLLRHETVSLILTLLNPKLSKWLSEGNVVTPDVALCIAAHHRKYTPKNAVPLKGAFGTLDVRFDHHDFRVLLKRVAAEYGLWAPPEFAHKGCLKRPDAQRLLMEVRAVLRSYADQYATPEDRLLLAVMKAACVSADVVASAISARDRAQCSAVLASRSFFPPQPASANFFTLIEPLTALQHQLVDGNEPTSLLVAGRGGDRMIAACVWLRRMAELHGTRQHFIALPAVGDEHDQNYALELGIDGYLTSSRSDYDLRMLKSEGETAVERAAKSDGLRLLSTYLMACSTETVLGFFLHAHKGVIALPAILRAGIVFDDVQAIDDKLFRLLLLFLKSFPHVPVLLTADSLPQERMNALLAVRPEMRTVEQPVEVRPDEQRTFKVTDSKNDEIAHLQRLLGNDTKAVWVRNQADWANASYKTLTKHFGEDVDIYHGRLKYAHRVDRCKRIAERFREPGRYVLVTTQVAEVAFDLDADLLISDLAPVPRLMRRIAQTKPAATCVVSTEMLGKPKTALYPYDGPAMEEAKRWIERLPGRPASRADLIAAYEGVSEKQAINVSTLEGDAPLLTGVWQPGAADRLPPIQTINIVLAEDFHDWQKLNGKRRPDYEWLRKHEIGVPASWVEDNWHVVGGVVIAPAKKVSYDYDATTGKGFGATWVQ